MNHEYQVSAVMNDGLVRMENSEYGRQLWIKAPSRKVKDCHVCDEAPPKGAVTWRALTNGYNRMHRICEGCMATMMKGKLSSEAP